VVVGEFVEPLAIGAGRESMVCESMVCESIKASRNIIPLIHVDFKMLSGDR
jgi:glucosamine 6-phosphate synthetase-like amidotransferase/phosphosugar isomerase protein